MNPSFVVFGEHDETIYLVADLRREPEEERGVHRGGLFLELRGLRLVLLRSGVTNSSRESSEHCYCSEVVKAMILVCMMYDVEEK